MADDFAIPEVKQGRSHKDLVRYILGACVGAVVLLLLFGKRGELTAAWHQISRADLGWLLAAIGTQIASVLSLSFLQYRVLRLSGASIALPALSALTLANAAIANTVPAAPLVSSAYRYRFYRRRGATSEGAGWTIFTVLVALAIGMSMILLIGVLIALAGSTRTKAVPLAIVGLVIVGAAAAILVRRDLVLRLLSLLPRAARRASREQHVTVRAVAERIESTLARMREIPLGARSTVEIVAIAMTFWIADFSCLLCGFGAVHAAVPWSGVLLAYGAAQVVGSLPIVPGGIGIIEGSLAVILMQYGADRVSALSAALVYRLVSFWLLTAIGWITVGVIARRVKGAALSSPTHLNNHHRNTLRQIFAHPTSHNIEWHSVVSLLGAVGDLERYHDGKVAITLGPHTTVFDPPPHKDVDVATVSAVRKLLADAGYGPEEGREG